MKKRNIIVAMLCSMCLAVSTPIPALADATKVVTLGADLTQDQKNTMMNYFKADSSQVQIITVTNQDEHNYLGKYIPSEQIGTRTLSCAYVKPTTSGGIKVRTANLNYVTCNMIATALSTAGVTNCEAVAACPYEVSGTGALTGVMMAYETASGQKLDATKKDLATQEVVVTGNVGQQIGQDNATNIINQAKMQIIGENIQNADEIYNIVNNIAVQNGVSLSGDELNTIVALLQQIAQQSYDIEEMKKTLENIQQNLEQSKTGEDGTPSEGEEESDGDDITANVDSDALGGDIKETSTEDPGLADETGANTSGDEGTSSDDGMGIPEATGDGSWTEEEINTETPSGDEGTSSDDGMGIPEATGDGNWTEEEINTETPAADGDGSYEETPTEETIDKEILTEEGKLKFEELEKFCTGEYYGDLAVLQSVVPNVTELNICLMPEAAEKITEMVQKAYFDVLKDAGASYVWSEDDIYTSAELNMMSAELKKLFGIDTEMAEDNVMNDFDEVTIQILYNDTVSFFEYLYGESSVSTAAVDETYTEENSGEYYEESYTEEIPEAETY